MTVDYSRIWTAVLGSSHGMVEAAALLMMSETLNRMLGGRKAVAWVNFVRFAVMEAALKLHSMMANHMAGSWLQKGGARKATCAERDEGAVGSVDAMDEGAVGVCMSVVYGERNHSRVRDMHPHWHVRWTLFRHYRYSYYYILGTGDHCLIPGGRGLLGIHPGH